MRVTIKEAVECTEWKTCSKCDEEKKVVMFSKSGNSYRPECKACDSKAYYAKKQKKLEQAQVKEMSQSLARRIIKWIFS